jgi:DNA helicase-2/ATP-dependent DNA helicase PcrA
MLINPSDDEALKRIINYPARGIGKTTLDKLEAFAAQKEVSMWEIVAHVPQLNNIFQFNNGTVSKLMAFVAFINEYTVKAGQLDAYALAQQIASASGILKDLYNGTTPEERSKYENLEELLNAIRDFVDSSLETDEETSIRHYLENVSLLTDTDNEKTEDRNRVSIMTVHSAKGLEFKYVYIAGVEEDLFPSHMSLESSKDLEEERRLFYVALTRAMTKVILSYARVRYKWGTPSDSSPSRFISEIDQKYIDWADDPRKQKKIISESSNLFAPKEKPESSTGFQARKTIVTSNNGYSPRLQTATNPDFKADPPENIQQGMMVEHQRFGKGKVVHIEGAMPDRKATVFFQQILEEKQLLLKFAKLRIVSEV